MIKRILYGSLLLALLLGGIGYCFYQAENGSIQYQSPAYRLSATELVAAFQQDEQAASRQYSGKLLEVRGAINLLNPENGFIYLGAPTASSSVSCTMDSTQIHKAVLLKAGDTVTIKGICTGFLIDVQLNRAEFLSK